jgi:hypothetical protein
MEALTSPKITVGVHCSKLRTKGNVHRVGRRPRPSFAHNKKPAEQTFYDSFDQTAYWCVWTQTGLGPDREPCRADTCQAGRNCFVP